MNPLLTFRDACLLRHLDDDTVLLPIMGFITHGPTYPQHTYLESSHRPERKYAAAIWRILDKSEELSQYSDFCFAIYQDDDGEVKRKWTLHSWATYDFDAIPKAISFWIASAKPKHPVQLTLFQEAA